METEIKAKTKAKSKSKPKNMFKKGNTASKGFGRPRMTPEQKALAMTSRTKFKTLLALYMTWTEADIEQALENNNLPILDMAVLKHLQAMKQGGSMDRVDWSLDHLLGKPVQAQKLTIENESSSPFDLSKLTDDELLQLKAIQEKASKA